MKAIYKYVLPFQEVAIIQMPEFAQVIRVDGIDGQIYLWAIVDTTEKIYNHTFYLYKTGMKMPDDIVQNYKYLGCGGIIIGMELMMYVFKKYEDDSIPYVEPPKWLGFKESGEA